MMQGNMIVLDKTKITGISPVGNFLCAELVKLCDNGATLIQHFQTCFLNFIYVSFCRMPQTCEQYYTLPETGLILEHVRTQTSRISPYIQHIQCVPKKRLPFQVKRQCRTFEFECFNSRISSFFVILAQQISINLQYIVAILKVHSTSRASLCYSNQLKLAYHNRKIHGNYNKSCTKRVNSFVYFEDTNSLL